MGYGEFYIFIKAKTASEAFNKAKQNAYELYGDNSHSGSVLEKEDFFEFKSNIKAINEIYKYRMDRFIIPEKRLRLIEEKKYFKNREKKTGRDKAIAIAHFLIGIECAEINSPEKPAGIVKVLKNEWLIFGLAYE